MATESVYHPLVAARHSAVTDLQQRLAFRLLLLCLVPLAIIAVLGVYAYRLSARVQEIEVLERVSYVDRIYREPTTCRGQSPSTAHCPAGTPATPASSSDWARSITRMVRTTAPWSF